MEDVVLRRATASDAQAIGAVYEAAGYRPDGTTRESDFHGEPLRELRLIEEL